MITSARHKSHTEGGKLCSFTISMGIESPVRRAFFQRKLLFNAVCALFLAMAPPAGAGSDRQETDTEYSSFLASTTYVETVKLLRSWEEGDDEQLLAHLFAIGDARGSDFEAACHREDQDTKGKAYLLLYLLGSSGTRECASRLRMEEPVAMLSVSDELSENDYEKLEQLFRARACEKAMNCNGDDLPLIDESLVYSLILDGSKRSMKLLGRMSSLAKASHDEENIVFDVAVRSKTLALQAKNSVRSLKLDGGPFEEWLRKSIFFVPADQRDDSEIKLLARNSNDNRTLVEVSYICGRLCGSGYYIVLRKNASGTWDYALIMRAWIS